MKVTFVQLPEGLTVDSIQWRDLRMQILAEESDVLITNEMPFGTWLAASSEYQSTAAEASISAHEEGLIALKELGVGLVLSSRAIAGDDKLINEALL